VLARRARNRDRTLQHNTSVSKRLHDCSDGSGPANGDGEAAENERPGDQEGGEGRRRLVRQICQAKQAVSERQTRASLLTVSRRELRQLDRGRADNKRCPDTWRNSDGAQKLEKAAQYVRTDSQRERREAEPAKGGPIGRMQSTRDRLLGEDQRGPRANHSNACSGERRLVD